MDRDQVFVRAIPTSEANWYHEVHENSAVTIDDNGRRLEAIAIPVHDADSINRADAALKAKYASEPDLDTLLAPAAAVWTVRLDPRNPNEAPLEAPAYIGSDFDSQLGPAVDMSSFDGDQKVDERVLLNPTRPD